MLTEKKFRPWERVVKLKKKQIFEKIKKKTKFIVCQSLV